MSSLNSVIRRRPISVFPQYSFTEFQHTGFTVTVEIIVGYEEVRSGLLAWHGMSITFITVEFLHEPTWVVWVFFLTSIRFRGFSDEL